MKLSSIWRSPRWLAPSLISLLAVFGLSCQDKTRVNECYVLNEVLNQYSTLPMASDRPSTERYSTQLQTLAEQLRLTALTDATLVTHRDELARLYQEQSEVVQAQAELMDADGVMRLVGEQIQVADQLTEQRRDLNRQLETQRLDLRVYCTA